MNGNTVSTGPSRHAGSASLASDGAQHLEGVLGPGALYAIDVPATWNGDLVVWVHGYSNPAAPVALPDIAGFRDFVMSQGFAIAVSSFSANGYAVAEAVRETHQLSGVFAAQVGPPKRTFLVGVSLGGIIGLNLVEKYPRQYDGALLVSGVVGGTRAEVEYVGDVRALYDYAYGGLPGDVVHTPENTPFPQADIVNAIQAHQERLPMLLFSPRMKPPGINGQEFVTSVVTALGFQWFGGPDLFDRTHDHMLYNNQGYTYAAPQLPGAVNDAINAGVTRYASTPDAEMFMRQHYEPTGDLRVKVLTLHTPRDPVVPIEHEALLRAKVEAAGRLDNLFQRTGGGYGHVVFPPQDIPAAFLDLVSWVNTGQKPV